MLLNIFIINFEGARDCEAAKFIESILHSKGIGTFRPEADMLPGSNRKLVPGQAIKDANYAIFLVSKNFLQKGGEHWRWLKAAKEQQEYLPPGEVFIIPVIIEDLGGQYYSSRFSDLQPMDLSEVDFSEAGFRSGLFQALPRFAPKLLTQ